jgi:hypothetical protein
VKVFGYCKLVWKGRRSTWVRCENLEGDVKEKNVDKGINI